jgi:anthranilate synthase component 2
MILIIDNYDSFTYNLHHYVLEVGQNDVLVKRNNKITIDEIISLNPEAIIISPGPCSPNEAGISLEIVEKLQGKIPILGVCLGHQAIGQTFGGKIIKTKPVHGKTSEITHYQDALFVGIPSPFIATRYHSLTIENKPLENIEIIATSEDGIIMAIKHKKFKIYGVQFHPESIASEYGHEIISNFLKIAKI